MLFKQRSDSVQLKVTNVPSKYRVIDGVVVLVDSMSPRGIQILFEIPIEYENPCIIRLEKLREARDLIRL